MSSPEPSSAERAKKRPKKRLGGGKELDRLVFFSDAIFAIVMTLLVLNIEVPRIPSGEVAAELPGRLLALWPEVLGYAISFLVVALFWVAHHGVFRAIEGYDRVLIWLNFFFLMFVSFIPFPASLLGEYGDQQLTVVIYAAIMATARLILAAIWWYATSGHRLVSEHLDPREIRFYHLRGLAISCLFLFSIAVSFVDVDIAVYSWIMLFVVDFLVLRHHGAEGKLSPP